MEASDSDEDIPIKVTFQNSTFKKLKNNTDKINFLHCELVNITKQVFELSENIKKLNSNTSSPQATDNLRVLVKFIVTTWKEPPMTFSKIYQQVMEVLPSSPKSVVKEIVNEFTYKLITDGSQAEHEDGESLEY